MAINRVGMLRPLDAMRRARRPWAIVVAGKNGILTLTEYGELIDTDPGTDTENLLKRLSDHVIFSQGIKQLLAITDPTVWEVRQRRSRTIEAKHLTAGTRIVFLPINILPEDTLSAVSVFAEYMQWLDTHGVYTTARMGWSTLGRHLFLSTLESPIRFFGPMSCGRQPMYGGRKGAHPAASFRDATKWDITGAYVHALGDYPMPRIMEPSKRPGVGLLDGDGEGIGFAIVDVPKCHYPPLPKRADKHIVRLLKWPTGQLSGWWTFGELRLAKDHGARITIASAFEGRAYHQDFLKWKETIIEGRALPLAKGLAKYHGNVLWSGFSVSPAAIHYKRYNEMRRPYLVRTTPRGGDFTRLTVYIAAITAARMRIRLHREALSPGGNNNGRVIHYDTDGVISDHLRPPMGPHGTRLGEWRPVRRMPLIEIRSANAYRYSCVRCDLDHPAWHYSVSGAKNLDAKRRGFERLPSSRRGADPCYDDPIFS